MFVVQAGDRERWITPRIARAAADGDHGAVRDDIAQGLRTSAVAIVPCAFAFLALGVPLIQLLYAGAGEEGARNIGFVLMAFALGLVPYSVQYVLLRGFYAYEDTRTPFFNTLVVALVNAAGSFAAYLLLPARWAVTGMALTYGLAYVIGVGVAWKRLRDRLGGDLDGRRVVRTYARLVGAALPASLAAGSVAAWLMTAVHAPAVAALAALAAGATVLIALFVLLARVLRIGEVDAMVNMVRTRIGR